MNSLRPSRLFILRAAAPMNRTWQTWETRVCLWWTCSKLRTHHRCTADLSDRASFQTGNLGTSKTNKQRGKINPGNIMKATIWINKNILWISGRAANLNFTTKCFITWRSTNKTNILVTRVFHGLIEDVLHFSCLITTLSELKPHTSWWLPPSLSAFILMYKLSLLQPHWTWIFCCYVLCVCVCYSWPFPRSPFVEAVTRSRCECVYLRLFALGWFNRFIFKFHFFDFKRTNSHL